MKILMNAILSNWIFMNPGALKEGVNIWSFRIYLSLESFNALIGRTHEHLPTCGTLKSSKRVKEQSGNPKVFEFAEYADADRQCTTCFACTWW
ncbi:hypothetical protein GLOIN_2v1650717 [Rhizophagus irregularis DAOM 181602=DAOM 197198]|nr:hypothetical protein RhiirB3_412820 [Rhizophagus irregularis]GET61192.1 hypothetical protein GLOIN_2v1650717 [Rhizophagus irregularis DAOM 181602=DAOM 197198]